MLYIEILLFTFSIMNIIILVKHYVESTSLLSVCGILILISNGLCLSESVTPLPLATTLLVAIYFYLEIGGLSYAENYNDSITHR